MFVYLDNSATTKVEESVANSMMEMLVKYYGNPSSMHHMGVEVEKKIKEIRRIVAKSLMAKEKEIYFTSGGTEANNIAIQGIADAYKKRGNHIITSAIEHPAVLKTVESLEKKGFRVSVIPVDEKGIIRMDLLEKELSEDTILVSLMHVNNEVGSIQPIEKLVDLVKKRKFNTKIHVDAIQSFGKLPLNLKRLNIDALSISAHKFHGPKGVGALFLKEGTLINPIVIGGGQEKGLRPGTENVAGIVGMGEACKLITPHIKQHYRKMQILKERLYDGISQNLSNIKLNSMLDNNGSPYILNISFLGIRGEVLLHSLEKDTIFVSTGSACSSNQKKSYSHVLNSMGLDTIAKEGAIRFSLNGSITEEEIDYVIDCVVRNVKELNDIIRGK